MATYSAGQATVDVLPSLKGFHKKLATELKSVNPNVDVGISLQQGNFKSQVKALTRDQKIKLQVEADTASLAKAEAAIKAAEGRITAAKFASSDATAKQDILEKKLTETREKGKVKASQLATAELKVNQAKRASASATNDLKNAEEGLVGAREALSKLKSDIDTRSSVSGVQRLRTALQGIGPDGDKASAALKRLAGSAVATTAAIASIGPAASAILLVGRAAVQAAGSLAILPGLAAAAAAVVGTVAIGATGISDAFKQMDKAQTGAVKSTDGLASAQKSLARAREDAARSTEQAEISAARSIRSADESLASSKRALASAQEAVNKAVSDATEQYQQLAFQSRDAVLNERQAILDLADAKSQLENARASGADGAALEKLQIAYERQVLTLDEAKDANSDLAAETKKANEVGINGSDAVLAALQARADATDDVVRAERDLNETKSDAAQSLDDQRIQNQRSLADALDAVKQAQISNTGSVDKYSEALNKLSPNARSFVETIKSLSGDWKDLKNTVQDNLFEGFNKDARDLAKVYLPLLKTGLGGIATSLNGVGHEFASALQQGPALLSVKTILDDTRGTVDNLKGAVKPLTSIFLDFAAVGTGVLKDLTTNVGSLAQKWADWVSEARKSGKLKELITDGITSVKDLGIAIYTFGKAAVEILKAVSTGFGGIGTTTDDASGSIKTISQNILRFVTENRDAFVQFGKNSKDALSLLIGALDGVRAVLSPVYEIIKELIGFFGGNLGTVGAFAGALYAMNKISLGTLSDSTGKLAGKFGELAPKITGVLKSLPLVGAAVLGLKALYDNFFPSADDLATKIAQGGQAARDAQKDVYDNGSAFRYFGTTTDELNAKLQENYNNLSHVQRAQQDLTQSQNDLTYAQAHYTSDSPEVRTALTRVEVDTRSLENAQKDAADAVKSATQKLKEQKDFILGQANAAIGYQRAQSRITDAQDALTAATAKYGKGSKEAKDAQLDLSSAMLDSITAAQTLAAKQTANSDSAVQAAGQTDAYNKQLAILATQTGTTLPPEIQKMVDGLSDSDLAQQGLKRSTDDTKGSIDKLPGTTKLEFPTDADTAKAKVDTLFDSVHTLVGEYGKWAKTYLDIIDLNKKLPTAAPGAPVIPLHNATGGLIQGPGTGTSDSIPSMLSNGEFVMNAASTSKYLPLLRSLNANKFASGGLVGSSSAQGVSATTDVSGLLSLDVTAQSATGSLQDLGKEISGTLNPIFEELQAAYTAVVESMLKDTAALTAAEFQLGSDFSDIWQAIATTVNQSWLNQNTTFSALTNGLGSIRSALQYTADWAVTQWDRMREAAAAPVRWVLNNPMNAGIIAAWNQLNSDFSFGQAIQPIPVGFATGGYVSGPGTGTSDSINAKLSNGEFVIPAAITKKSLPFLEALRKGEPEALQATGYATGGLVTDTGSELNAKIFQAQQFAKAQDGKPYIWGGVGPVGYDCSGYMSAITNVLRGMSNPYQRVGVARSEPWPGFVPGLSSAFAVGGSQTHTAGTLGGVNVESTGNHVRFGNDAHGADDRQFPTHSSLPFVGGQFVPGGGPSLDPAAIMANAFSGSKDLISQIPSMFPGNRAGAAAGGMASQALSAISDYGVGKINSLASMSIGTAGSPEVIAAVRAVASTFGWGDGPQWAALQSLIQGESGFNPNARNPATSASGLFQKMTSLHGAIEPTAAGQTQWGLNYIQGRYGSPLAAYTAWLGRSPHWYAKGGIVPGTGDRDTEPAFLTPGERVLPVAVTRTFDRFVANLSTADRLATNAVRTNGEGTTIHQTINPSAPVDERQIAADSSRRISFFLRNQ